MEIVSIPLRTSGHPMSILVKTLGVHLHQSREWTFDILYVYQASVLLPQKMGHSHLRHRKY